MCALKVILGAKNPFPWVEIPPIIDIGPCLVGNEQSVLLSVLSKGAGATFKLSSSMYGADEEVTNQDDLYKVLRVDQFIAYPNHFELRKDETGDIIILFMPHSAGQFTFTLQISTECGLEWSTQIKGCGVNLNLTAEEVGSGQAFKYQEEGELALGRATVHSTNVCRKLLVKSNMPVSLRYYWIVEDCISTAESVREGSSKKSSAAFSVNPCFGVFESNMITSFTFTFSPNEPRYYQQLAWLYIDTRSVYPFQSPRWKELKSIMQSLRAKIHRLSVSSAVIMKQQMDEKDGNENRLLSSKNVADNSGNVVKSMALKLSGVGEPIQVELIPPVLKFLDIVEQGQSYTTSVLLKNNSCVDISFFWKLPDLPCIIKAKSNHVSVRPLTGTINAMGTRDFEVCLKANTIGTLRENIFCQISGGPETALYIEGSIQGLAIQIAPAIMDFGIVQVGNSSSLELNIRNRSNLAASFKLSAGSRLPTQIDRVVDENYGTHCHKHSTTMVPTSCCQEKDFPSSLENALDENKYANSCSEVLFSPSQGMISGKEHKIVKVGCKPLMPGLYKWAITCEVPGEKSLSQYAIAQVMATASELYLSPSTIDLGVTYVGFPIQRTVSIYNLSALPCRFNWPKEVCRSFSFMAAEVKPVEGLLPAHDKQEIIFTLTPEEPGEKNFIYTCIAQGMVRPFELCFRVYISGISCRVHIERPLRFNRVDYSKTEYSRSELSGVKSIDRAKLPALDFGKRCPLGVVQSLRVLVQNETPVAGRVHASAAYYGLVPALPEDSIGELTGRHVKSQSKESKILEDCRQVANHQFWSECGCSMSLQRQWASMCIKRGGQGIAIVLSATEGTLQGWGFWEFEVFCYACMPGTYHDILHIMVDDNIEYRIPISIGVIGTPLSMRENRFEPQDFGRTGETKCILLKLGPMPVGYPQRSKTLWVSNSAPYSVEVEWEFYESLSPTMDSTIKVNLNVEEEGQKTHVVMLGDPDKGPIQLKFEIEDVVDIQVALRECVQNQVIDPHAKIYPAKQCIPPQSSVSFIITYYSEEAGIFISNLRGNTYLQACNEQDKVVGKQAVQEGSTSSFDTRRFQVSESTPISPVHISLQAVSFPPRLTTEVEEDLKFVRLSSDSASHGSSKRNATLINNYDCNLRISVAAEPPFYVKMCRSSCDDGSSNNASADEKSDSSFPCSHSKNPNAHESCESLCNILLPPKTKLQLEIEFLPSEEMLISCEDQKFEDDLMMKLFNKFEQRIPMTGMLLFPKIETFSKSMWFGAVLKASSQTLPFTIRNTSKADACWSLVLIQEEEEEAAPYNAGEGLVPSTNERPESVFKFDIHDGVLRASTESDVSEQLIHVTFSPHEAAFYPQRIKIQVLKGRGCTILLEGQGVSNIPQQAPPPPVESPPPKKPAKAKRLTR